MNLTSQLCPVHLFLKFFSLAMFMCQLLGDLVNSLPYISDGLRLILRPVALLPGFLCCMGFLFARLNLLCKQ